MPTLQEFAQQVNAMRAAGLGRFSQAEWKPTLPMAEEDKRTFGVQEQIGLPPDWDYKTSQVGPDGEALPRGAVGWTPQGEAYYGGSGPVDEWLKSLGAKLSAPTQQAVYGDWKESAKNLSAEADKKLSEGDFWGALGAGGSALATRVSGVLGDIGEYIGQDLGASEAGDKPTVLQIPGRVISAGFQGLLAGAGQFAEWFEQARGGLQEAGNIAGLEKNTDPLSSWLSDTNALDGAEWFRSMLYSVNVVGMANELFHAADAFIKDPEAAGEAFSAGWEAGRILYTTFKDPAIKAEYMRRYRAGESPYMLAEELQDPTSELGGELLADPLNFVGLIGKATGLDKWIGKAARLRKAGIRATEEMATAAGDLGKFTKAAAEVANDAQAFRVADDFAKATVATVGDIANGVSRVGTGTFSLSTLSKRASIAENAGHIFKTIAVQLSGDPDKFADVIHAMTLIGDEKTAKAALTVLKDSGIPLDILLSERGIQMGVIMRDMMKGADGAVDAAGFLEKLSGAKDVEGLLKLFDDGIDKSIKRLVPTLKEYAAKEGAELGASGKLFARVESAITSSFYRNARQFYGTMFMGVSPGYAVRAGSTDLLHLFVDNPRAAVTHLYRKLTRSTFTDDWLKKVYGGIPDALKDSPGAADIANKSKFQFATRWASDMQTNMGKTLYAEIARSEIRKGYDKLFEVTVAPSLREAGASDDFIRVFRRELDNTHNFGQAVDAMGKHIENGYIDAFDTMAWMSDPQYGVLDDFKYLDEYQSTMRAVKDAGGDVIGAHREFLTRIEEYAKESARLPTALPEEWVSHAIASLDAAGADGLVADSLTQLAKRQAVANKNFELVMRDAVSAAINRVTNSGPEAERAFNELLKKQPELRWALSDNYTKYASNTIAEWSKGKLAVYDLMTEGKMGVAEAWQKLGFSGKMPSGMTAERLRRYFWSGLFYPTERQMYAVARDGYAGVANKLLKELRGIDPSLVDAQAVRVAVDRLSEAKMWDIASVAENGMGAAGSQKRLIYALADLNGVPTISETGKTISSVIRDTVNKYLPDAEKYADDALIPYDVVEKAFKERAAQMGEEFLPLPDAVPLMERPIAADLFPPIAEISDAAPMPTQMVARQLDGIRGMWQDMEGALQNSLTTQIPVPDPKISGVLDGLRGAGDASVLETKLIAGRVGAAARDFAFLPYLTGKTNFDMALSLIYPYHFWHTRTYVNWMKRIVSDPQVVAAYAKYRDTMAEIHAGAPEWWKYNMRSDEMFGTKSDNPIFFNLEAVFNPLNNLTAVDFNDPNKRVNWWTQTLDDMGKYGPTPWPFIQVGAALALKMQGDTDAAARWAGRLIPQTATAEAFASMLGSDYKTLDPFPYLFGDGTDPYMANRAARSLATMVENKQITQEQAIDAAATKSGQIWQDALTLAERGRAPGQILSSFVGFGFRPRTVGDMQTDRFDAEYRRLWTLRSGDAISPAQFTEEMNGLQQRYPFMDAVLIARKDSGPRDTALAWNVLRRLPPGGGDLAESLGVSSELVSKYYDTAGKWDEWTDTERSRFMAGINDLRAILAIPDTATRQEWDMAKVLNGQVDDALKARFGEDILDQINAFYAAYADNSSIRPGNLVSQALDYKRQLRVSNPLLAMYYEGMDGIAMYYEGFMWSEIESTLGSDFFARRDAGEVSSAENKKYYAILDKWNAEIDARIVKIADYLPEAKTAALRPDANVQTSSQQQFVQSLAPIYIAETDVIAALGETGYNIVRDFLDGGAAIPYKVRNKLVDLADQNGMSYYELLNMLRQQ